MGGFLRRRGQFYRRARRCAPSGMHWNFAVGTDLAHIVGKSVVAAKRHRALGNVDLRLGLIMALGTIGGAEVGAQLIQMLKRAGNVDFVVSVVSIVIYFSISTFMIWESWTTLRLQKRSGRRERKRRQTRVKGRILLRRGDGSDSSLSRSGRWFRCPTSGVKSISLWVIVLVSFIGGRFQRFPRRRRRLHPDADDGLHPRHSDASRGRDRSF